MPTTLQDDYFGLGTLGYDPYAQQKADTLARYQTMDSMLQQQTQQAPGTAPKPTAPKPAPAPITPYAGVASSGGQSFAQMQPQQYVNPYLTASAQTAMQTGGAMGSLTGTPTRMRQASSIEGGEGTGGTSTGTSKPPYISPEAQHNCPSGQFWDSVNSVCRSCPNGDVLGPFGGCQSPVAPGTQPGSPCPEGTEWQIMPNGAAGCWPPGTKPGDDPHPNGTDYPGKSTNESGGPVTGGGGGSSSGGGSGGGSNSSNVNVSGLVNPNVSGLQQVLANFFSNNYRVNQPNYPGNLNVGLNGLLSGAALGQSSIATNYAGDYSDRAMGIMDSLQGFNPIGDVSPLKNMISSQMNHSYDPQTQGLGWIGSTVPSWYEMLANGGAPNITGALNDIQTRGMMGIEDQNAQIREQFGKMGLSAGSDVAEAVARGSSRGMADINSQQSQLIAQVLGQAQDRRVQTMGMAPGMATGAAQPYENVQNRTLQQNLANLSAIPGLQGLFTSAADQARANAGIQLGTLGAIPGISSATTQPYSDFAKTAMGLAGIDLQGQSTAAGLNYQNFRDTNTPAYLNQAVNLATGAGQIIPPTQSGGNQWLQLIGAIAPYIIMAAGAGS